MQGRTEDFPDVDTVDKEPVVTLEIAGEPSLQRFGTSEEMIALCIQRVTGVTPVTQSPTMTDNKDFCTLDSIQKTMEAPKPI